MLRLTRRAGLLLAAYISLILAVIAAVFLAAAVGIWAAILWGAALIAGLALYLQKRRQQVPATSRPKVDLRDSKAQPAKGSGLFLLRAALVVVAIPTLLVVGYAAFSLQGHREDFPSKPMQTWPIGVSSLLLAAALSWVAARPSRGLQPAIVSMTFALFLVAWASYLS